jgi:hypothetical protein
VGEEKGMAKTMIREVVAAFHEPEALQSAVSDLQSHGFNRADISFMAHQSVTGHLAQNYEATRQASDDPRARREAVTDETDIRQRRTLEISLATTLAGFAAAGFTIATGGATALAAGVTAAAVGAVGGLGALLGRAYGEGHETFLREQLERGGILVWVRAPAVGAEERAQAILRKYSAHDVHVHEVPASP